MNIEQQQIGEGRAILARRKEEVKAHSAFPAFSRVVLELAGEEHVFWLVEKVADSLDVYPIGGGTVGGVLRKVALDEGEGIVVSKHAPLGLRLDQYGDRLGVQVPLPGGEREWGAATATVIRYTHYVPERHGDDALNGSMYVSSDPLNFESLRALVVELEELIRVDDTLRREVDVRQEIGLGEIRAQMEAQEERRQAFREAKRARIRHVISNAALRNQPKLDSEQLRVKQLRILDGQIIIHGGPGTGKTTTLLDRIGLLTDQTIREHVPSLSPDALRRLVDLATAYRLFTPNELHEHYLKEAMNAKGLLADRSRLTTWAVYRDQLARKMGLLKADPKKSRFVKDRAAFRSDSRTLDVGEKQWSAFIEAIYETFAEFVSWRHRGVLGIDATSAHDPALIRSVQHLLTNVRAAADLVELLRMFQSLHARAHEQVTEASREAREALKDVAARLHARILDDTAGHDELVAALAELRGGSTRDAQDGDPEAIGDESLGRRATEWEEPVDAQADDEFALINRLVHSVLRKLALRRGLTGVRMTKLERATFDHVHEWIDHEAVKSLAPKLLTSLVRPCSAGPDSNVVNQVGPFFLWLRRTHFTGRLKQFLHPDEQDRLAESGAQRGKRIGPDELDLVLFLQLWLLRLRRVLSPNGNATPAASQVFEDEIREVVAVDEATDFSSIQLACMAMTANPEYNCVTFSGDLMQRMTDCGLRSWDEYGSVANEVGMGPVHQDGLRISYRQSRRLLSVTNRLYQVSTGLEAPIKSPYQRSEFDPHLLFHDATDLQDCADWMAARILEIRASYDDQGEVPTIAVLVPDEGAVHGLARAFEESPYLPGNVEIDPCPDGRVLGAGASVRIFNVEHIKGLEFEAAFFHDMGKIATRFPKLADKLLYVGLSRASLYLGITVIGGMPDVLAPLANDLVDGDWST